MPLLIITHAHPHGDPGVEPLDLPCSAEHAEVKDYVEQLKEYGVAPLGKEK